LEKKKELEIWTITPLKKIPQNFSFWSQTFLTEINVNFGWWCGEIGYLIEWDSTELPVLAARQRVKFHRLQHTGMWRRIGKRRRINFQIGETVGVHQMEIGCRGALPESCSAVFRWQSQAAQLWHLQTGWLLIHWGDRLENTMTAPALQVAAILLLSGWPTEN
jgi:hypothetical protein